MPWTHKQLYLIPLDARPVCYDLPKRLAKSVGLELAMPAVGILGHLKQPADLKALERWTKNSLTEKAPVLAAIDTIAYGGLISSRVGDESTELLEERLTQFLETVNASPLLGFSSILRIPNYNNAEEEPNYWAEYGEKLYRFSTLSHQITSDANAPETLRQERQTLTKLIPKPILDDFLTRRERNFEFNQLLVHKLFRGDLDYLTLCQDDTGSYGLNVQEAEALKQTIQDKRCADRAHVQTGADEVACCLMARWASLHGGVIEKPLQIYPLYSNPATQNQIARFDGLPISTVVERAILACGAEVALKSEAADLTLLIHTPPETQGDLCEPHLPILSPTADQTQYVLETLHSHFKNQHPITIADVAFANGSDPQLGETLLHEFSSLTKLYGYAGWNTPGNTIGTALSMGILRLLAEKQASFEAAEFNQLLAIRFADDWLYQSKVRGILRKTFGSELPDMGRLNAEMADGLALIKSRLGLSATPIQCDFPCGRTFEISIQV